MKFKIPFRFIKDMFAFIRITIKIWLAVTFIKINDFLFSGWRE